jgi:hypothetical protein
MRPVLPLLCAVAACLLTGCGGASSSSMPTRDSSPPASAQPTTSTAGTGTTRTAPTPTAPAVGSPPAATTPQARGFREQALAVCARSHVIRGRIRTARNYARLALPLVVRTSRNLRGLEPPRAYAPAVQALVTSLGDVINAYTRVNATPGPPDPDLRSTAIQSTRRLAAVAAETGLLACGPPVGRR